MEGNDRGADVQWLDEQEQAAWWALLEVGSGLFDALSADLRGIAELIRTSQGRPAASVGAGPDR